MQVFLDRNEANVTRISFLSKKDIQVYQINVLLIVDNFILTNKLPVTRKEYLSQEVDKIFQECSYHMKINPVAGTMKTRKFLVKD